MKKIIRKFSLEQVLQILSCCRAHYNAYENWEHGEAVEAWYEDDILCLRYEDGSWYHYKKTENGWEWW